jgi:DNA-binding transcriptional LysR family regulator
LIGVTKVSSRFELIPFLREELVLIVSPSHPLAQKKEISLKAIRDFPFIIRAKGSTTRKIILQAFHEMGIRPSLLIEAGSSEFIKQWVSEGRGISISVKRIVEGYGGSLEVKSEVGKGSLFRFTLPVAVPPLTKAPNGERDTP